MSNELNALAERVAALERTVAQLQATTGPKEEHWLDRFRHGVTDEEAFEEAMRLGREFRKSYRDDDSSEPAP